jgi:predicted membrane-bound dolichyl-phosphate-mannose-protein mannosyltransferase
MAVIFVNTCVENSGSRIRLLSVLQQLDWVLCDFSCVQMTVQFLLTDNGQASTVLRYILSLNSFYRHMKLKILAQVSTVYSTVFVSGALQRLPFTCSCSIEHSSSH